MPSMDFVVRKVSKQISEGKFNRALYFTRNHIHPDSFATLHSLCTHAMRSHAASATSGVLAVDYSFAISIESTHAPYILDHCARALDSSAPKQVIEHINLLRSLYNMYTYNSTQVQNSVAVIEELKQSEPTIIADFIGDVYRQSRKLERLAHSSQMQFDLCRYLTDYRKILGRALIDDSSYPDLVLADYMGFVQLSQTQRDRIFAEQRYLQGVRIDPINTQKNVRIAQLQDEMKRLIALEEYEQCARLRDKIDYYIHNI
ncbi:MAG TPA: UvrB/UvrC motif-containing protein [Acidobacteriota bacterium]|nr:UvrB/UvrC motif-containing protein [Acidobacteriota bacterium]